MIPYYIRDSTSEGRNIVGRILKQQDEESNYEKHASTELRKHIRKYRRACKIDNATNKKSATYQI